MAVYGFLREATESKEPKGKAKRLIDKIMSIKNKQDKDSKKAEELKDDIDKEFKELNKATKEIKEESYISEESYYFNSNAPESKLRYYSIDIEKLDKKLQKMNNPKNFMEEYAIESDLRSYLNKPQELTKEVSKKLIAKVKNVKKKNSKALEELYFETNKMSHRYDYNGDPRIAKYPNDNDCLIEITFKSNAKDIKDKIEEANKLLDSAYSNKLRPALDNYEKCEKECYNKISIPILDQVHKWSWDKVEGIDYDAWYDVLEALNYHLEETKKGYFSHTIIHDILLSYFDSMYDAVKFNNKVIEKINSGAKKIEKEVQDYHDQPEYGSKLMKGNSDITSKEFTDDIKSRYNSKKIKKCNLDYLLNEFKRNDDWEDTPYETYNKFVSKNKATLDKIRNSDPVLVGKIEEDPGSYMSYAIYCVKSNTFYRLTYHEDSFGYEVSAISFDKLKEFYEDLKDMGG